MQLSTINLVVSSILFVLAACTTGQSLTRSISGVGRIFHATGSANEQNEDKFVTDPSANVNGIFKKLGDMTIIMPTDTFSDDFEDGRRKKRNAVLDIDLLWPGGIVPYEISSYFNDQEKWLILSAMRHWENKTCIRFRSKNSTDQYSIFIMTGSIDECRSFVGRMNITHQPQGVTLGKGCVRFPIIVHELGHAIGFYHEHSRPDRDEHIEVRFNNIKSSAIHNFEANSAGTTNLLGYGYDYASIMHYDRNAFSSNNRDTIVAKDPSIPFGDAEELSPLDIAKTIRLYSCGPESTWPPALTVVPPDTLSLPANITCGRVSNGQKNGTYTSPGYPSYQHNLDCAYVIKVPKGYYVQLEIRNFAIEQSAECSKDYVEIYKGTELINSSIVDIPYYKEIGLQTPEGRICNNSGLTLTINIPTADVITLYFHTDGSGSGGRGLYASFTAIDENECQSGGNNCHQCNNLPGGYECVCRDGYYHSAAAGTCYDVNECAYSNAGCQHKCINSGGSYQCECYSGYYLLADGKSCQLGLPDDITCGQVSNGQTSGTYTSPGYPNYQHNLDCAYVIKVPQGYTIQLTIHNFNVETSAGCSKDYIELYVSNILVSERRLPGYSTFIFYGIQTSEGRFCNDRNYTLNINTPYDFMTVYFHTDGSGSGVRGLNVSFTAVGVDECTYDNGGCQHKCVSSEGSYRCECDSGYYLQEDNKSCKIGLPDGITCGQVSDGQTSGTYTSPGYPNYQHNLDCAYVIKVPQGYTIQLIIHNFNVETSAGCSKDYMELYFTNTLISERILTSSSFISYGLQTPEGRLCDNRGYSLTLNIPYDILTVYFHTDGSGSGARGLNVSFTAIDVNECADSNGGCQQRCINSAGTYQCGCNSSYYLQADNKTCATDINECATNNGGCDQICTNTVGSFQCSCRNGYTLANDEKACQDINECTASTDNCQQRCINTAGGFRCECNAGFRLNSDQRTCSDFNECATSNGGCRQVCTNTVGSFQCSCQSGYTLANDGKACQDINECTANIDNCQQLCVNTVGGFRCECNAGFHLNSDQQTCSDFNECATSNGGCGQICTNTVESFQCSCRSGYELASDGKACQDINECTTNIDNCQQLCVNTVGGFRCECNAGFRLDSDQRTCSVTTTTIVTTTSSPTTPPLPQCGGLMTTSSGTFQTPNWPETYPNNIDCEWRIQLPDANRLVEISCYENPFGIAGSLPACEKDFLKFYDGHSKQGTEYGPFCHYTKPGTTRMSSNKAMAVFHSGPSHSSSRRGFKCSFQSIDVTQASQCGGVFTAASGSFQSPNWPQTYPVNVNCTWTITLPDASKRVEIDFMSPFGIAGSLPICPKDKLHIYDDNTGTQHGPYCYFTVPNPPTMTSNRARVVLLAGPAHSPSRVGFRATYRSV